MKHITLLDTWACMLIARDCCRIGCFPPEVELPVCVDSLAPPRSPASTASTALDLRQHRRGWRPRWTCCVCSPGDEDVERVSLGSNGWRRWAPHAGRLTLCRVPLFRRMFQGEVDMVVSSALNSALLPHPRPSPSPSPSPSLSSQRPLCLPPRPWRLPGPAEEP